MGPPFRAGGLVGWVTALKLDKNKSLAYKRPLNFSKFTDKSTNDKKVKYKKI